MSEYARALIRSKSEAAISGALAAAGEFGWVIEAFEFGWVIEAFEFGWVVEAFEPVADFLPHPAARKPAEAQISRTAI